MTRNRTRPVVPAVVNEAEALVQFIFNALEAGRWDEIPRLIHPLALSRFRSHKIEDVRMREQFRHAPRSPDPEMPAEVAKWFEDRRRRNEAEYPSELANEFARIESLAELEKLTAEEMMARWLEAHDMYEAALRHMRGRRDLPAALPDRSQIPLQVREVIGGVAEDAETIQVLYRTRVRRPPDEEPDDLTRTAVATVRAVDGARWALWSTWQDHELFDGFSMGFALTGRDEIVKHLAEIQATPFRWPEDGAARVTAAILDYPGEGVRPRALALGVTGDDGAEVRVDLPFASIWPLMTYVEPWAHLPPGGQGEAYGTDVG